MSWKRVGDDARQHTYGVPMKYVRVLDPKTVDRFVAIGWRLIGRCANDPTGAWFAQRGSKSARRAKLACSICPVQNTCLGAALLHGEEFGVWGGFDAVEREWMNAKLQSGMPLELLLDGVLGGRRAAS